MSSYSWKNKYYNHLGEDVEFKYPTKFYSLLGAGNVGSRLLPANSKDMPIEDNPGTVARVLSGGNHSVKYSNTNYGVAATIYFVGSGIRKTILNGVLNCNANNNRSHHLTDMSIGDLIINSTWTPNVIYWNFYNCDITKKITDNANRITTVTKCIIRVNAYTGLNNSYVGVDGMSMPTTNNLNLFDKSDVLITATDVNTYKNNYIAFNNCRLKIGTETEYKALTGLTEDALRADFVARCQAQTITVPSITDFGETLPVGRWVFSNNSCADGHVYKDSVIHLFEKRRFMNFGHTALRADKLNITGSNNVAASFSPKSPSDKVVVTNDSISLSPDVDIAKKLTAYSDSNIIYLGGKKQLNAIDVIHNMQIANGVFVDSTPSLSNTAVTVIEENKTYIVRSADSNAATITYSGVQYSSPLTTRNNIFRGVKNVTTFTTVSGNPQVFEILDEVLHQTIEMRIVNKIPSQLITSGTLQAGYWYLVEHDASQDNKTDYITYKGVAYYALSSFLVDASDLTFTKTGTIHLRRCWRQDFDFSTEITDKVFWTNEQKPQWFHALPEDMRCLMKGNSGVEIELQKDEAGNYIASGHELFYKLSNGDSGTILPAYPIKGAYMQLRLKITTQNPM